MANIGQPVRVWEVEPMEEPFTTPQRTEEPTTVEEPLEEPVWQEVRR